MAHQARLPASNGRNAVTECGAQCKFGQEGWGISLAKCA